MNSLILIAMLLGLMAFGYRLGRTRALAGVSGDAKILHSLPSYHGFYVALWCGLPALLLVALWLTVGPQFIDILLVGSLPPAAQSLPQGELNLLLNDIRNIATGNIASRKEIARTMDIPNQFLSKIAQQLARAGIVGDL